MLDFHDEGWFVCEQHCGKKFKNEKAYLAHIARIEDNEQLKRLRIYEFQSSDFKAPFGSVHSQDSESKTEKDLLHNHTIQNSKQYPILKLCDIE